MPSSCPRAPLSLRVSCLTRNPYAFADAQCNHRQCSHDSMPTKWPPWFCSFSAHFWHDDKGHCWLPVFMCCDSCLGAMQLWHKFLWHPTIPKLPQHRLALHRITSHIQCFQKPSPPLRLGPRYLWRQFRDLCLPWVGWWCIIVLRIFTYYTITEIYHSLVVHTISMHFFNDLTFYIVPSSSSLSSP